VGLRGVVLVSLAGGRGQESNTCMGEGTRIVFLYLGSPLPLLAFTCRLAEHVLSVLMG
jgi:hypothetical protein